MSTKTKKNNPARIYFQEKQEQAVVEYINSQSQSRRNQIYNEVLAPAFEKMVESIIRRYKLFIPDEEFEDTYTDTLSHLVTKLDKFSPDKGKKAYSYYGTICKNYLIGRIDKFTKEQAAKIYTDDNTLNDNPIFSDETDYDRAVAKESIELLIDKMEKMIQNPIENQLRDAEVKIGKSLITLLENWDYVLSTDGSRKLNKSAILLFLRESTGMGTKAIRENMKKFKKEFYEIKKTLID